MTSSAETPENTLLEKAGALAMLGLATGLGGVSFIIDERPRAIRVQVTPATQALLSFAVE